MQKKKDVSSIPTGDFVPETLFAPFIIINEIISFLHFVFKKDEILKIVSKFYHKLCLVLHATQKKKSHREENDETDNVQLRNRF